MKILLYKNISKLTKVWNTTHVWKIVYRQVLQTGSGNEEQQLHFEAGFPEEKLKEKPSMK